MKKTKVAVAIMLFASVASAAMLGPERVTNGGFDDASGWTLGVGWQIVPGPQGFAYRNEGTSTPITQNAGSLVAGETYRVVYTISGTAYASDPRHWLRVRGDTNVVTPLAYGDGTFTFDFVAPSNPTTYGIVGVYGFSGSLDDVSIRQITP